MGGRLIKDKQSKTAHTKKPGGKKEEKLKLPKDVMTNLYQVYRFLDKETRQRVGLMLKIPVFIQDPMVAMENPTLGIQGIQVRLEAGLGDGPTSARIAVVDFNGDSQTLRQPITWEKDESWFRMPSDAGQDAGFMLPDAPPDISDEEKPEKYLPEYRQFISTVLKNPYYHQMNVWAVVQRVLEFYEEPSALGRPVPWGFDGNRLLVVPHAGYGENAFYDQHSKSLQFYYFGDQTEPGYTCLSHDIIAHETGHAILDGIRPLYNQLSSVQTSAFHEFIGDLTAILLALFNNDIRRFIAKTTEGRLNEAHVLADIAEQFGKEVEGRAYLRTAFSPLKMNDKEIVDSLSPHQISQVLTGAMYDILVGIATKHLEKNLAIEAALKAGKGTPVQVGTRDKVTPAKALWWAADRFRRVALQPLDLCPPCDIQFLDYARAVLRNDVLTNPVDEQGYRPLMLDVFHERGLCPCAYKSGKELPKDCRFLDALKGDDVNLECFEIESISRSRTAAYYFLNNNRALLFIPPHQDFVVADLYETNKFGAAAERLPHEVVIVYTWQELVFLENDPVNGLAFGKWNGQSVNMTCGGTLVFDDRGNLRSWFHKPGTEHIAPAEEKDIRRRKAAWEANPNNPENRKKKNQIHKQDLAGLASLEIGRERRRSLRAYLSTLIQRGLVGLPQPENLFMGTMTPVMALEEGGVVRFESTPHLRKSDFGTKEEEWLIDY